jgi:DNA-binding transcriptional LysR family regulator
MNYTLHQLQVFLKIVETNSVTKAAQELNLTQPAVSIQLKNFQEQFEIPLTEVIRKKLYVTDFGQQIALAAAAIVQQVEHMDQASRRFKGQLSGKLRISVVSTGKYVMPYFLTNFINQHPGINLFMDVTNKDKVVDALEANEVDFALVSIIPPLLAIEKIDLLQNKLFLVGHANKPISSLAKSAMPSELPFIFREKGSGTRQIMERFIEKSKLSFTKKMELTSNEAVKQAVLAGLGYSIMPLIGIKNELHNKQLSIYPIKGLPIKTTWSLIWLKGKQHTPVSATFIQHLKNEKTDITERFFNWYEKY